MDDLSIKNTCLWTLPVSLNHLHTHRQWLPVYCDHSVLVYHSRLDDIYTRIIIMLIRSLWALLPLHTHTCTHEFGSNPVHVHTYLIQILCMYVRTCPQAVYCCTTSPGRLGHTIGQDSSSYEDHSIASGTRVGRRIYHTCTHTHTHTHTHTCAHTNTHTLTAVWGTYCLLQVLLWSVWLYCEGLPELFGPYKRQKTYVYHIQHMLPCSLAIYVHTVHTYVRM